MCCSDKTKAPGRAPQAPGQTQAQTQETQAAGKEAAQEAGHVERDPCRLATRCVAFGLTVLGALVMLLFWGALASLGPAVITQSLAAEDDPIGPLARMQAWRDLGAACGPPATGFLLTFVSAELQHGAVAAALAGALIFWMLAPPK